MSSTSPSITPWTLARVQEFIDGGITESTQLDYKRSDSLAKDERKKNELTVMVSSFANASGGLLIFGVEDDKLVPTNLDNGVDPNEISKEWINNVLNSKISPRVNGVTINQIFLDAPNQDRVIYVLEIEQTTSGGPHQAADKRYYKRSNASSVPMEDYEIRDVMGRAVGPSLFCELALGKVNKQSQEVITHIFDLEILAGNKSSEPALYAHFDIFLDSRLHVYNPGFTKLNRSDASFIIGNYEREMNHFSVPWVTPVVPPLWSGTQYSVTNVPMVLARKKDFDRLFVVVEIKAPKMERVTTVFTISPDLENPSHRVRLRTGVEFMESAPW